MTITIFDKVENIVGKGENAGHCIFPFPTMLTKSLSITDVESWVGQTLVCLASLSQSRLLMTLKKWDFENNVGKGGNAGNQHFLLFPCFQLFLNKVQFFLVTFIL